MLDFAEFHNTDKHVNKISFWYFVPKAGVAFIFLSVIVIFIWNQYRKSLAHSFIWIIAIEILLFSLCFLITRKEIKQKIL
jgi:hypothetical protein